MIKEAYEQGFLEACDEYGLDEDDMEVLGSVAEGLEKEAKLTDYGKKAWGGLKNAFTAEQFRAGLLGRKSLKELKDLGGNLPDELLQKGKKEIRNALLAGAAKTGLAYGGTAGALGAGGYMYKKRRSER